MIPRLEASWIEKVLTGIGDAIGGALGKVWENISQTIWDKFVSFLVNAINELAEKIITEFTSAPMKLFSLPVVEGLLVFFQQLGWLLLITGTVLAVFDICIEYQSMGHFNIKRQFLPLAVGLFAVNLFTKLPILLYQFAVDQQGALMDLILLLNSGSGTTWQDLQTNALTKIFQMNTGTSIGTMLYVAILIIVYIYSIVKVFFSNIKRGGILFTMIGVGSLYMISIPRGYTDGFWSWSKQVVGLCVTTVLQNVLLYLGCIVTLNTDILLGIGVMLAAGEVPRIAGQFGLDTSTRANFSSIAYTANSAISLARSGNQIMSAASKATK